MGQNSWMALAVEAARQAAQKGEVPVAAVLVYQDAPLVVATNRVEKDQDATAHAEMIIIRKATALLKTKYLYDCDLYVTLEPCTMCAGALSLVRLRRLYFGAYDPKRGGVDHGAQVFRQSTCHHRPEVYGGIYETLCGDLLKQFFKARRK